MAEKWVTTVKRQHFGRLLEINEEVKVPDGYFDEGMSTKGWERAEEHEDVQERDPRDVSAWQGTRDPSNKSMFERAREALASRKADQKPDDFEDINDL